MPTTPFAWDIKHYQTLQDYLAALLPFPKPAWISGITLHHTESPTRAQWRGLTTMQNLKPFYQGKGWSAGPHLFLAALTPGPLTDGIWAGTPLAVPGIHAGACNPDHIGIEVVGDYDVEPWPLAVSELVYGVTTALMQWGHIPVARVQGHRECLDNKSCPGKAINMDAVRAELGRRLSNAAAAIPRMVTPDSTLLSLPRATEAQCVASITRHPTGTYTRLDVASIVRSYYAYAAGLDPLLAIAQMIHETGNLTSRWSQIPRRNPAGIGVTGAANVGLTFDSWEDAVRAHVGRLLAYALKQGTGTPGQQLLVDRALALRKLPVAYRGSAPVLRGLNTRWAPSATYSDRIVEIANGIMGQAS